MRKAASIHSNKHIKGLNPHVDVCNSHGSSHRLKSLGEWRALTRIMERELLFALKKMIGQEEGKIDKFFLP